MLVAPAELSLMPRVPALNASAVCTARTVPTYNLTNTITTMLVAPAEL